MPDDDELLAEVFRTAPVAMQLYRLENVDDPGSFRFMETTPGAAKATGVTPEQMREQLGKTFNEFVPQFVETGYPAAYRNVVTTGEPTTAEFAYGDERFREAVYLAHAWRVSGPYLGVMFEDVTERRRMEQLLSRKLGELERSNADLERFATVASHELQEPLRTIASFTDLLARDYCKGLDAKGTRYLDYVRKGAARLQHVLDALLDYARLTSERRRFEMTPVAKAVESARENLAGPFEASGAKLETGPLPEIEADPHQLAIVFQNLFSNSIRFAGDRPPCIEIGATRDGHNWHFEVRDRGIGFSAEFATRVFEMFRRLHSKEEYPGTGVGLASCKKIVESHGGKMWAESIPGEGATFHFTLPERQPPLEE